MNEVLASGELVIALPEKLLRFINSGFIRDGENFFWKKIISKKHIKNFVMKNTQENKDLSYREWSYNRIHIDDYITENNLFKVALKSAFYTLQQWQKQFPSLACLIVLSFQFPEDDLPYMANLTLHHVRDCDLVFDVNTIESCTQPCLAYLYTP